MRIIKFLGIIAIIIITFVCFTGCEEKSDIELLKDKNLAELNYLENTVLSIVKNYIMGEYYNNDSQDWLSIKKDFLKFANNSNTILIDLTNLDIDGNKIIELENSINSVINGLEKQNENDFFKSLSDLYDLIPIYLSEYYDDTNLIKTKIIKSNFLKVLYYSNINDFENATLCINLIEKTFSEMTQNQKYIEDNYYKINKNYVIIQELKIAIELQEKENVKIKFLESLESF